MMENLEQRIARIAADREHGSRWLVNEVLILLDELVHESGQDEEVQRQQVAEVGDRLAEARPAMAALAGIVRRVLAASADQDGGHNDGGGHGDGGHDTSVPTGGQDDGYGDGGHDTSVPTMAEMVARLRDEFGHASERIGEYARAVLSGTLLTCSRSGTVLEVLAACSAQIERVIVLEGRPRYEGREMARELSERGIVVTLITDAQADIFLPQCSAVVVGADSVLVGDGGHDKSVRTGVILNKAGTALLAWACAGRHIPFYVVCESLKISAEGWSGDVGQLEEKEPEEVWPNALQGVQVRNFYFDCTPVELVSGIITERGVLHLHS